MRIKCTVNLTTVILLAVSLASEGCFNKPVEEKRPLSAVVWPTAPEIPRIRFLRIISKPEDLEIHAGIFRRFIKALTGKVNKSIVAPYGLETDSSGRLYVVDTGLKTIHVFDAVKNAYHSFPTEKTSFTSPIDIAVDDRRGFIYVSDSTQRVVKIFRIAGKTFEKEIGKGVFERPTGIAINEKTSELLVVDTLSAKVLRYNLNGLYLKGKFGGNGTEAGKFHYPTNIFVAENGNIFVSDSLNFRIQVFTPQGEFLSTFGSAGDSPGYFSRPRGVAADSEGNIYVVDAIFDNIQIFDQNGSLLMAFGGPGNGYGQFWLPAGIYIDKNDTIYVSDYHNKRVQVFQYLKKGAAGP